MGSIESKTIDDFVSIQEDVIKVFISSEVAAMLKEILSRDRYSEEFTANLLLASYQLGREHGRKSISVQISRMK